jgi:hypothetical protein
MINLLMINNKLGLTFLNFFHNTRIDFLPAINEKEKQIKYQKHQLSVEVKNTDIGTGTFLFCFLEKEISFQFNIFSFEMNDKINNQEDAMNL